MKKVMVTGIFMLLSMGSIAQVKTDILPKTAQDFIKQHFTAHTIAEVEENSDWKIWEDDKYEVKFTNGTEIDFDENGNVMEIETKNNETIPEGALPATIISYLKSNYPNAQVISWEKESKKQEIELSDGTELEFDLEGTFLKID